MYRLSYLIGRLRSARLLCAGAALVAVFGGCTVNEPKGAKAGCFAGEPCGDAAADTQSEVVVTPDAHAEPASSTDDTTNLFCPTECNPEDALACAPGGVRPRIVAPQGSFEPSVEEDANGGMDAPLRALVTDAAPVDRDVTVAVAPKPGESAVFVDSGFGGDQPTSLEEPWISMPSDAAFDASDGETAGGRTDGGRGQLDVLDAAAGEGVGTTAPVPACQLAFRDGTLLAECAPAGAGAEGSACASARDCAPGLGCVGSAGAGQCLPYCCGGNDSCKEGSYCTQRPLRSLTITDDATAPTIPVCAVADNCSLMFGPCTEPGACSCPAGMACTVVRASTTTCVEPGLGAEGESCPCAAGYFCSQGTNTCLKFCNTNNPASGCGTGECQPGPSGFPMGWGLCVGD